MYMLTLFMRTYHPWQVASGPVHIIVTPLLGPHGVKYESPPLR